MLLETVLTLLASGCDGDEHGFLGNEQHGFCSSFLALTCLNRVRILLLII
jgi:hypothetical protein